MPTKSFKTYEEAEQYIIDQMPKMNGFVNGGGTTNTYAKVYKSPPGYTVDMDMRGCHGWMASTGGTGLIAVFTSMYFSPKSMDIKRAHEYWDWMLNPKLSPWRNFLKAWPNHKVLTNKAGEYLAFGFVQDDKHLLSQIPIQPLANIFVATRTPLEKYGYNYVYDHFKTNTKYSETKCRFLASIATGTKTTPPGGGSEVWKVRDVDGYHFPFDTYGRVNWWKFKNGVMDCDNRYFTGGTFAPINNIWAKPDVYASYSPTMWDHKVLFEEPKKEAGFRAFSKVKDPAIPVTPMSTIEIFEANVALQFKRLFDETEIKATKDKTRYE